MPGSPEQSQYAAARKMRPFKDAPLPAAGSQTDPRTIQPPYLLSHQNRFDPIVHTPGQVASMTGKTGERKILDKA
jgi:hypothetical protein